MSYCWLLCELGDTLKYGSGQTIHPIYIQKEPQPAKERQKKWVWRPATPSSCWSWSRQRLAFILSRNGWLNMTGRKWESEASDASRYCQITRRMRQISLCLHLVLVISLASFSSLIWLVWRYVAEGLIKAALTMRRNYLKQRCYPNLSLPGYQLIQKNEQI